MDSNSDKATRYRVNAKDLRTMALAEKDLKMFRALSLLAEDYEAMAVTQAAIDRSNAERAKTSAAMTRVRTPFTKEH